MRLCPTSTLPSASLAAIGVCSEETMQGSTLLVRGMPPTRENQKIAASIELKNTLEPEKKKFPIDPLRKSNCEGVVVETGRGRGQGGYKRRGEGLREQER